MMVHGLIVWLIIGAIAGWAAGKLVKGGGFGLFGDIVVGIVGAWIAGFLGIGMGGFIGSIISATLGAVLLLVVVRLIKKA